MVVRERVFSALPTFNVIVFHCLHYRRGKWYDTPKLLVEETQIDELLRCCGACAGSCVISKHYNGAYMTAETQCLDCGHLYSFQSTTKQGR